VRWLRVIGLLVLAFLLVSVLPVLLLRWWDPPGSAFMLEARVAAWRAHERYETQYQWVPLERISPHAALAVIASEDQQFPFHAGFDVESIRAAVRASEHGKRLRGASTISQQVAKNLFLWSGRSLVRKGLEAWLTVLIESLWPKERILEIYLNIVELGPGVFGVQAAAEQFFHRSAAHLTREQAALFAAVLPNPHRLHVARPSAYVLERRDWILDQMRRLGGPAYLETLDPRSKEPVRRSGAHSGLTGQEPEPRTRG
jgi:monofunctional glycosyltransferase